jgi:hypothetical protein
VPQVRAQVVITGLDPVIHPLRNKGFLRRLMDARVKPGHDGGDKYTAPTG